MLVKVGFEIGEGQRLFVPVSALVERGEVTGVYVVSEDQRVSLRQVRIGRRLGDRVEVLAGLSEAERIALDPQAATMALMAARKGSKS